MFIRWLPRHEGGYQLRPVVALVTNRHWYGVRFGREQHKSFAERYQGTRGIPIQWHYIFGGRLSFHRQPYPDERRYPRIGEETP